MNKQPFRYEDAFDRNLGWLTKEEQNKLKNSTVAIAGLGGAGSHQASTLARLGIGHFKLADPDTYEMSNLNRQGGANQNTLGFRKVEVIRDMLMAINPELKITIYPEGVNKDNVSDFLSEADLVIDGIDFFATESKMLLFEKGREAGLDVITACPVGFGGSVVTFAKDGMTFREYFDLENVTDIKDIRNHIAFGLTPTPLCLSYMDKTAFNNDAKRAASVAPGLLIVAALASSEAVKLLTGKRKTDYAPNIWQVDFLTQQTRKKFYPMGMRSPFMRLKRWFMVQLVARRTPAEVKPVPDADWEKNQMKGAA